MNTCGNERHPDGAWHPAQSIGPLYMGWPWQRLWARITFWWRRKQWGCACPRRKR